MVRKKLSQQLLHCQWPPSHPVPEHCLPRAWLPEPMRGGTKLKNVYNLHWYKYSRVFKCNAEGKRMDRRQIAHSSHLGSCFREACSTVLDTTAPLSDCLSFWAAQGRRCLLHNCTRFATGPCRQTLGCCCSPISSALRLLMLIGNFDLCLW